MGLPCKAQATYFEDGGGVIAGPFNFEWQEDGALYREVGGGSRTIQWNAVDNWVFTDDIRNTERDGGGIDEDDPAGDYTYIELDYAGNNVIYTITVTTSGSSCSSDSSSDSDSSSESSSSSSSGSEKSFSSVSESEAQP